MTATFPQPAWIATEGRREGRYVIGPLLGHGAMGDVYEAWDIVLARPVALKILQMQEPAAMVRFMHEAQLHARLDNPSICRIYDVDASGGTPRIAMQLIRGPNLEQAAKDLRLDEIIDILAQVADAVHAAHQINLVHRDLKPSNILLQWQEHGGWTPYICDFGLAMALDGPTVTQPLAITGTPAYMAPEQVRGDRSLVGPATDVYGLGSTLYFLLLGRPPCVSTSTEEMLRIKRERGFPTPRALQPDLRPDLEAILLRCLEPEPGDRYPSAAALAQELRRIHEDMAPRRDVAGRLARVRAWCVRHPWPLAGGLAALLLAAALPAVASRYNQLGRRRDEAVQAATLALTSLELGLRSERLLPVHDLRPGTDRVRQGIAGLRGDLESLNGTALGALAFTLGRMDCLLDDPRRAEPELERARRQGYRSADAAFLLARIQCAQAQETVREAAFRGQPAPAAAQERLERARQLFREARFQTLEPLGYAAALEALADGDLDRAATLAQEGWKDSPWDLGSAVLASECLTAQALRQVQAGDTDGAADRFRMALDLAQAGLSRGPSDPRLHHAALAAALGLAAGALERGALTPAALASLDQQADQQLILDPDSAQAQSDWLRVRALEAQSLAARDKDDQPVLDQALQFYWTRTREPRTLDLRLNHLELYWLQAERDFEHGADPTRALQQALKDPGHSLDRGRDVLGDLLNLKARLEDARGQDPRPTLADVRERFGRTGGWNAWEVAAKASLIQAQWELRHRIDPLDSIRQAQALLQRAMEAKPTSASAHALQGLADVLEARVRPADRTLLLAGARERLRWSQRLNPANADLARLREALARI